MDSTMSISTSASVHQKRSTQSAVPLHRCRFPDYTPSSITSLALTPNSFDATELNCGAGQGKRGVLAVGRSNGTVELMVWGGYQGWVNWRTLPSSFPPPPSTAASSHKKPTTLLSHLTWTHQTTLSESDLSLYSDDLPEATKEIESLKKGKGLRLFGVGGLGSELVEWEWGTPGTSKSNAAVGMIKSTLPTLPPIFALVASPTSSTLAISCEDSTIRLINILDGELELMSKIELGGIGKVRALSLAWGRPRALTSGEDDGSSDHEEDQDVGMQVEKKGKGKALLPTDYSTPLESYLLAGCSNSTIRRFDAPTNSSTGLYRGSLRMTLDRLKGEHTVVWALTTLKDGTVVSGDSMGNVKFWDGQMGTQLQSFKGHKADVLCLGVGSDGTSIFTSGIDQKIVEYRQVSVGTVRGAASDISAPNARWIQSSGRRMHSHDVRAIVISPPYEPFAPASLSTSVSSSADLVPVMTSAGLDLSLILTPVASPSLTTSKRSKQQPVVANPVSNNPSITFESTVHRRQAYVSSRSSGLPFSITTNPSSPASGEDGNGRLLIARRERSVGIWGLGEPRLASSDAEGASGPGCEKLLDLEFKLQTNLISSGISPNGKWLAVSDLYETKLYRLTTSRSGELVPRRQKTFVSTLASSISTSLGTGSGCITFSKDSSKLFLSSAFGASVAVVELTLNNEDETFEVVAVFGQGAKAFNMRQKKALNGVSREEDVDMNGSASADEESDSGDDEDMETSPSGPKGTSSIVVLVTSDDGKWLATADLDRNVEMYDLTAQKHYLTLPTSPSVPTALAFLPSSSSVEPTIVLTLSTNVLLLYGLTTRRFHPWSLPLASSKYNILTDIREPALGLTFEPASKSLVALVWGANWVAKINLDELRDTNFGSSSRGKPDSAEIGGHLKSSKSKPFRLDADRKRAREEDEILSLPSSNDSGTAVIDIKVTRKYQPLFLFDFIQSQSGSTSTTGPKRDSSSTSPRAELVAVERTWYDIVGTLPEAFFQTGVFGT